MGWPPEKYRNALEMAESGLLRAYTYSERQAGTYEVNEEEDRTELADLLERTRSLLTRARSRSSI